MRQTDILKGMVGGGIWFANEEDEQAYWDRAKEFHENIVQQLLDEFKKEGKLDD